MRSRRSPILFTALVSLLCTPSCSRSSGGGGNVGVDNAVQAYVVENSVLAFSAIAQTSLLLPIVLVPGLYAGAGITFDLDAGGPPNTYDYVIPLDSDWDGTQETTLTGSVTFSADPFAGGAFAAGFQASVDLTVTTNGGMGVFTGVLDASFDLDGNFRLSGAGTYDDAETGSTVSLSVDPSAALIVAIASPQDKPNACAWSVDGEVHLDASSGDGDYSADWQFSPGSKLVQVVDALFTPPGGTPEALSSSKFEVSPCPGSGALSDWVGHFTFDWFCVPVEDGQSDITVTAIDGKTIQIVDEDPPGSGEVLIYYATRDANDPHIVHGSFQETDGGGTYEELFTWILAPDGQSYQQVSEYLYVSGSAAGNGGCCGGVGTRN